MSERKTPSPPPLDPVIQTVGDLVDQLARFNRETSIVVYVSLREPLDIEWAFGIDRIRVASNGDICLDV